MIRTLEELLRSGAQKLRLEAEKRRAQDERQKDAQAHKNLDTAMEVMAERGLGAERAMWGLQRFSLQRQAVSRRLLTKDSEGYAKYQTTKTERDDRPAERLITGKPKGIKRGGNSR